ncbi:MAG: glutamate--tRNA ligase [Campylobacterota bacterium]|nr:glutamate--tRNA ligase [Campylobacterota bacterium]
MLRFAPSPTGDMHIGDLRVALFNYIIAKQKNEQFIIRIEDTDREQNIEGKDSEILQIMEKFALPHDRVFHQSENLHIHQTLAIKLLEEGKAFVCTCTTEELEADREQTEKDRVAYRYSGRCESMGRDDLIKLKEEKQPFVLRLKKPDAPIASRDAIKGDIKTAPDEVDSFVILRTDSTPTYNFACSCDDMLTNIDFIIRGEEHMSSTPKQIHIKQLLGYDSDTTYAHLPIILNSQGKKMSRVDDAGSIKWLFQEGFIPDAIINYLIGLGNKTPTEIFTLPDALEWFELDNISKSPALFDIDKLRFINRQHLKGMGDKELSSVFGFADADIGKLAKIYLEEASTVNELERSIKDIFSAKDFGGEWGEQMLTLQKIIFDAKSFDQYSDFESYLQKESGLRGENFSKPLRILLTRRDNGPNLSDIYPHIKSYLLEIIS